MQYQEHTEASKAAQAQQAELLANIDQRRRMQSLVVPTDSSKIRAMLRALRDPVTLFGERDMERRERLRKLLANLDYDRREVLTAHLMEVEVQEAVSHHEKFYTEGPHRLQELRMQIAQFSATRAMARLEKARCDAAAAEDEDEDEASLVIQEVCTFRDTLSLFVLFCIIYVYIIFWGNRSDVSAVRMHTAVQCNASNGMPRQSSAAASRNEDADEASLVIQEVCDCVRALTGTASALVFQS